MAAFQRLLTVPGLAESQEDDDDDDAETSGTGVNGAEDARLGDAYSDLKARFKMGGSDQVGVTDYLKQEQKQQLANVSR